MVLEEEDGEARGDVAEVMQGTPGVSTSPLAI